MVADSVDLKPRRRETEDQSFVMPITLLDFILIGVMLVSALLAMIRGFMREVLSIAAWVIAAVATLYAYSKLLPYAKTYFNNDIIAAAVVIGGTFIGTLIIVSVITVKFSDMVLDSRVGALDRTLGFLFGLGRGLIIVVVAFLFFAWLVPPRTQPSWVANAKSKVVLQSTGEWLMSMLPDDPESTILKRLKRPKPDEGDPADAPPDQRGALGAPTTTEATAYGQSDRLGMRKLIESKATR
jgi:membrane protein required for colicin V production